MSNEVRQVLLQCGVHRIFSGHKPHGECPVLVRHPAGIDVWHCDTSYSDPTAAADTRGRAISLVAVTAAATSVHGVLSDGREHGYTLPVAPLLGDDGFATIRPPDELVLGRQLIDTGAWVATRLKEDGRVRCVAFRDGGFRLEQQDLLPEEAATRIGGQQGVMAG